VNLKSFIGRRLSRMRILYFGGGLIGTGHHWYLTGQAELNIAMSAVVATPTLLWGCIR
jgi:nitric oxide reductase large subunit